MTLNLYIFAVCWLFMVWMTAIVYAGPVWVKVLILFTGMLAGLIWLSTLPVSFGGGIS